MFDEFNDRSAPLFPCSGFTPITEIAIQNNWNVIFSEIAKYHKRCIEDNARDIKKLKKKIKELEDQIENLKPHGEKA